MRPESTALHHTCLSSGQTFWSLSSHHGGNMLRFEACKGRGPAKAEGTVCMDTGQPLLIGHDEDWLSVASISSKRRDCLHFHESAEFLVGIAQLPANPGNLEQESHRIYRAILETVGSRHLYRIWNFVPDINHVDPGRMENYKLFCCGRTLAFAEEYGDGDFRHFPSASATGCRNGMLTVVFLAGNACVTHWENPEQVPAYKYPHEYGPRSPAFARASRFRDPDGDEWILVAGTAAIKGSETVYPGNFERQLAVTFDNLDLILGEAGLTLGGQTGWQRHFKVFLRRRENLPKIRTAMREILGPKDTLSVVEADICRSNLEVEVEILARKAG